MTLETDGRVGRVVFTRPESLNSVTEQVLADLEAVCDAVEADPGLRVLIIAGSGRAFSVGLDLDLLDRAFADPAVWERVARRLSALTLRLERLPAVVIAEVNGLARAGGFELVLAADLAVVAESARLSDAHAAFAVIPVGGSTSRLPRIVGRQRAREIFLSGRWIPAEEAVRLGLALKAVPDERLQEAVAELAASFAGRSRAFVGAMKRQLAAVEGLSSEAAVEPEVAHFLAHVTPADSDGQEGYRSWRENRRPSSSPRVPQR